MEFTPVPPKVETLMIGRQSGLTKTLRIMKLTAIFLLSACLTASAHGFSQQVTLSEKDAPLPKVFKQIQKQTGFSFLYTQDMMKDAGTVTVELRNASLTEAVKACLAGKGLSFAIIDQTVVIKKEAEKMVENIPPPPIDVKGRVVNENGEPVASASVTVKGNKNKGTTTDAQGYFALTGVDDNVILIITATSIETVEVKVNGRTDLGAIRAKVSITEGEDVIVKTNYWETTKRKNTGNIFKVTSKEIENLPVTTPLMALQGRVPGLDITPYNGAPGSAARIQLRGQNSVRFDGGNPLYVIDGIPIDSDPLSSTSNLNQNGIDPLVMLDPNNISSVEVLKDADATAIYGSRGANGVIIITTKKKGGASDRVNFGIYFGAGHIGKKMDLMNTDQYLLMRREALTNNNRTPSATDYDLNGIWDTTSYTDWQDVLLGGTSNVSDVNFSISGGSTNTSFRLGGGYHSEGLIFPGDFGFDRITGFYSMNHISTNKKFQTNFSISYGINKSKFFDDNQLLPLAFNLPPDAPSLYQANGDLNWAPGTNGRSTWSNPLALARNTEESTNSSFLANGILSYEILRGLTLRANFGYTEVNGAQIMKRPIIAKDPTSPSFPTATGQSNFSTNRRGSWISEPQLVYARNLGKNEISIILGSTFQVQNQLYNQINGIGYTSDVFLENLSGAVSTVTVADEKSKYRYAAVYFRAGYNYKGRYILNLTGRRDGSSRFGPGRQFGNFGAIGAAWIFSDEKPLMKAMPWLSLGKLRISYGTTGNDQIGDYRFYDTYRLTTYTYQNSVNLVPTRLFNPDYAWESTRKFELALEVGMLNNRISASASWYRNRSSNQLVDIKVPTMTGFPTIFKNFDATVENSGWEFILNSQNISNKEFRWVTSINFSIPKNKLVKFVDIQETPYASIYQVGAPLTIQRLYTYNGVDPQTGLYTFEDVNRDGIINDNDRQFMKPLTRTYGGLNNSLSYKGFELSFLLQFVFQERQKGEIFSSVPGFSRANQPVQMLDRWTFPGENSTYQLFSTNFSVFTPNTYFRASDFSIGDASFLRLKTLTFSYNLNSVLSSKIKIASAKIFVQGQNLFTVTRYLGLDPETGIGLPPLRFMTAGIQLQL